MKYLDQAVKCGARRSSSSTRTSSRASTGTGCRRRVESALFGTKISHLHVPGPARRRRRLRQRGAASGCARGARSTRRSSPRTPTAGTSCVAALDRQPLDELLARGRASTARSSTRSSTCYAAARSRRAHLVDGHHAARARGRGGAGHRERRAGPGQRRAATARGSCRSAATPACRAAPRWARTPRRSPAALTIDDRARGRARRRSGGSTVPAAPGPHRAGDDRRRGAGRARRAVVVGRQLPRRAARSRRGARRPRARSRCGCTPTSC